MPAQPPIEESKPSPAADGCPKPMAQRVWAYRHLWIVGTLVFAADQVTKSMIAARLPFGSYGPGAQIEIFPGFLNLVHVGNPGAAWSMFAGMGTWLAVLALATLAAVFFWRRTLGLHYVGIQPAFGMLCGGILGNVVDRFRHDGHVIDFLDFHFGNYTYPTFNVADSGICVGVFWYVLWSLKQPADAGNAKSQTPNPK